MLIFAIHDKLHRVESRTKPFTIPLGVSISCSRSRVVVTHKFLFNKWFVLSGPVEYSDDDDGSGATNGIMICSATTTAGAGAGTTETPLQPSSRTNNANVLIQIYNKINRLTNVISTTIEIIVHWKGRTTGTLDDDYALDDSVDIILVHNVHFPPGLAAQGALLFDWPSSMDVSAAAAVDPSVFYHQRRRRRPLADTLINDKKARAVSPDDWIIFEFGNSTLHTQATMAHALRTEAGKHLFNSIVVGGLSA